MRTAKPPKGAAYPSRYTSRTRRSAPSDRVRTAHSLRQKRRAIIAYLAGVPWDTILMQTGVPQSTLLKWIRQEEELRRNCLFDLTLKD